MFWLLILGLLITPSILFCSSKTQKNQPDPNYKHTYTCSTLLIRPRSMLEKEPREKRIHHVSFCYLSPLACHSASPFQGVLLFEPSTEQTQPLGQFWWALGRRQADKVVNNKNQTTKETGCQVEKIKKNMVKDFSVKQVWVQFSD